MASESIAIDSEPIWALGIIVKSFLFARKALVNTERVPPGHPIILLKSNKFNMAALSVKRSINIEEISYSYCRMLQNWLENLRIISAPGLIG